MPNISNWGGRITDLHIDYLVDWGKITSTSECGLGITWTEINSPTLSAAAHASVAALTAPTSPLTGTD